MPRGRTGNSVYPSDKCQSCRRRRRHVSRFRNVGCNDDGDGLRSAQTREGAPLKLRLGGVSYEHEAGVSPASQARVRSLYAHSS